MIIIKTMEEIEKMDRAGDIVVDVHKNLRDFIKPGVSTMEINDFAESIMRDHGGVPEQIGYNGYPYATCTSVNDEICHGFPTSYVLKEGDLVTVDMVVSKEGYMADSAWTYLVGEVSEETRKLYDVTKESLYKGIEAATIGNRIGDIGRAIEDYVEGFGFSVVRDFTGHGIGTSMHEDPQILHYAPKIRGPRITEGMVFTIEPMINAGAWQMKMDDNGWTSRTRDGSLSCQFEHTLAVTKDGIKILTDQEK